MLAYSNTYKEFVANKKYTIYTNSNLNTCMSEACNKDSEKQFTKLQQCKDYNHYLIIIVPTREEANKSVIQRCNTNPLVRYNIPNLLNFIHLKKSHISSSPMWKKYKQKLILLSFLKLSKTKLSFYLSAFYSKLQAYWLLSVNVTATTNEKLCWNISITKQQYINKHQ